MLRNNNHHNKRLQAAYNKYGTDAFHFEIIELVECSENLTSREQFWMDHYESYERGFNQTLAADTTAGIPQTEATKKLLSAKLTAYWASEDVRKKQSERKKEYFATVPGALEKASEVMLRVHSENPEMRKQQAVKVAKIFSEPCRVDEFKSRMATWRSTLTDQEIAELARKSMEARTPEVWERAARKTRIIRYKKWLGPNIDGFPVGISWVLPTTRGGAKKLMACCRYTDLDGNDKTKLFSVEKYGLLVAWKMICEFREIVVLPIVQELIEKEAYETDSV